MIVRRLGPLSLARVTGLLYAGIGLIAGAVFSLFALILSAIGQAGGTATELGPFGALFGIGAILFFPIFYGVLGFVGGLLVAALYNLVARTVGGLEIELVESPRATGAPPVPPAA
jgi:hypothetical protein